MVHLPNSDSFILSYVAAAFVLKFLDLVHLLAVQCNVDIFFIDWEHPKFRTTKSTRAKLLETKGDPFISDDVGTWNKNLSGRNFVIRNFLFYVEENSFLLGKWDRFHRCFTLPVRI